MSIEHNRAFKILLWVTTIMGVLYCAHFLYRLIVFHAIKRASGLDF